MEQPIGTGEPTPYAPPMRDVPVQVARDSTAPPIAGPTVRPASTPYDEPLPPEIAAVAADHGLGDLVKAFRPRRSNQALVIGLLIVSIGLIWCVVPIYVLWLLFRTPNLNRRLAAKRLYVFDKGFVIANKPTEVQTWRWSDIASMLQKVVMRNTFGVWTGTTMKYTVTRTDGTSTRLTNFWTDVEDLGDHINIRVAATLLPSIRRALAAGQGVQFGDVTIDRRGIISKNGAATWAEIASVEADGGYIRVVQHGRTRALSSTHLSKMPNPTLFAALAKELRASAGQR